MLDFLYGPSLGFGIIVAFTALLALLMAAHTIRRGSAMASRAAHEEHFAAQEHHAGLVDETTITEERWSA